MYLLDTSVILELLLDQEKADDVERLLRQAQGVGTGSGVIFAILDKEKKGTG